MRNRARRLMKESIRKCNFDFTGYDVIFIARNTIKKETKLEDVKKSIISAIKKTKVLCR